MSFDARRFTQQLLSESLFYDEEYGTIGNLSLIDTRNAKERFVAFYSPQEKAYLLEKAVEWDPMNASDEDDIGYAFASDTESHLVSEDVEEIAKALMNLAQEHNLQPSIVLSFEDDDDVV